MTGIAEHHLIAIGPAPVTMGRRIREWTVGWTAIGFDFDEAHSYRPTRTVYFEVGPEQSASGLHRGGAGQPECIEQDRRGQRSVGDGAGSCGHSRHQLLVFAVVDVTCIVDQ
ncbi:UNVERIFIED_CONTAM: hypothetical protein DES50_1142 [Williamsia faeni]